MIWWLPYLTQHACLYRIIRKNPELKYKILVNSPYHFELHIDLKFNKKLIKKTVQNILNDICENTYSIIKVRGCER